MTEQSKTLKRALLSVSDKRGIVEFATELVQMGIEIVSTGGTAKTLKDQGLDVRDVSDLTSFPEMMEGRVKTLHPKIHGGLLYKRDNPLHETAKTEHDIPSIDLLVVNLYPFENTVARNASWYECIENIDIGGPAMIRSSAKNHQDVTVVVDPSDYKLVISELRAGNRSTSLDLRKKLAAKAFARTASYDRAITDYFNRQIEEPAESNPEFPETINIQLNKAQDLRYGENPHQSAAFYHLDESQPGSISSAKQLQGKELSYNNIADTDAALECVRQFEDKPACVIVKHANPCGVAEADNLLEAYNLAYRTDPESAFGGIIAFNQSLDSETAEKIINQQFAEVIIAPQISDEVKTVVANKKNIRLLECGTFSQHAVRKSVLTQVTGGMLVQDIDNALTSEELKIVTEAQPSEKQMSDMMFAWKVAKFVKSNAIVFANDGATLGIGAGQMSRVNSTRIAQIKAEHADLALAGSAVASDAFFPFADGLIQAAEAGATAIIQPGGSMRDQEVIDEANRRGLVMLFTGMRHFRH